MSHHRGRRGGKPNLNTPSAQGSAHRVQADIDAASTGGTLAVETKDTIDSSTSLGSGYPEVNQRGGGTQTPMFGAAGNVPAQQSISGLHMSGTPSTASHTYYEPTVAQQPQGVRGGSTFKPSTISVSNMVKLNTVNEFVTWKSKLIGQAKMGGYSEYLELDTKLHWNSLSRRYAGIDREALYGYYRDNHSRISGALQLAISDVIPNFDVLAAQIATENIYAGTDTTYDADVGGAFNHDNAHLIYTKLVQLYEKKSIFNVTSIWKQLVSLTYNEQTDPIIYMGNIQSLWSKLNEQLANEPRTPGSIVPESLLVAIMISHLPRSLQYIVPILDSTAKVTPNTLIQQLQLKYIQQHPQQVQLSKQPNTTSTGTGGFSSNKSTVEANNVEDEQENEEESAELAQDAPTNRSRGGDKFKRFRKRGGNYKNNNDSNTSGGYKNNSNTTGGVITKKLTPDVVLPEQLYSAVDDEEEVLMQNGFYRDSDSENSDSEIYTGTSEQGLSAADDSFESMWTFKLDSGATRHIIGNPNLFLEGTTSAPPYRFSVKSLFGTTGVVALIGKVRLNKRITLGNVWYVRGAKTNLISVGRIADSGAEVLFKKNNAYIVEGGYECFEFERDSAGLFIWKHPAGKSKEYIEQDKHFHYDRSSKATKAAEPRKQIPKKSANTNSSTSNSTSATTINISATNDARAALQKQRETRTSRSNTASAAPAFIAEETVEKNYTGDYTGNNTVNSKSGGEHKKFDSTTYSNEEAMNWHQVMGHTMVSKGVADAMNLKQLIRIKDCEICLRTKTIRKGIGTGTYTRTNVKLDRLDIDLLGPISIRTNGRRMLKQPSLGGKVYAMVATDPFTKFVWIRLVVLKSEVTEEIKYLIKFFQTQFNKTIKRLHTDGGKEFINEELNNFCRANGIERTYTCTGTPAHNGMVERMNRKLATMVKAMLLQASASQLLWGEAITYATYIHNRTPLKALGYVTPYYMMYGCDSKINKMHIFGSNAVVNTTSGSRDGKFQPCTITGIYVGVSETQNGLRIFTGEEIIVTRDATIIDGQFDYVLKSSIGAAKEGEAEQLDISAGTDAQVDLEDDDLYNVTNTGTVPVQADLPTVQEPLLDNGDYDAGQLSPILEEDDSDEEHDAATISSNDNLVIPYTGNNTVTRTGRTIQPVIKYGSIDPRDLDPVSRQQLFRGTGGGYYAVYDKQQDEVTITSDMNATTSTSSITGEAYISTAATSNSQEPSTYKQAINSTDSSKWTASIAEEINALKRENVLIEVPAQKGIKLLITKWEFKIKTGDHNEVIKYKSRLVVKGYSQIAGVDFTDTFAPVAKAKTIKLLLAIAAMYGLNMKQIDFKNAFLNSELPEDIYIAAPEGYQINTGNVFKLNKSLYGLKQAPFLWNATVNEILINLGYTQSVSDPCVYFKYITGVALPIIISVYVDDVMILYDVLVQEIWLRDKKAIATKYPIDDIGDLGWILKMKVTRLSSGNITLSQQAYAEQLVKIFYTGDEDASTSNNPNMVSIDLTDPELLLRHGAKPLTIVEHERYRSIVGALLYLSNTTRVDISFTVNQLCRAVATPTTVHMKAAINVIKYIKGTAEYCLTFYAGNQNSYSNKLTITGYSDADFAGDKSTRKSTSGSIVKLNNSIITWNTRKQSTVALSTMEAEYTALVNTSCDCKWITSWLAEVLLVTPQVVIFCDNQSTIHILDKDDHHATTKHMDIRLHFIRDYIRKRIITVKWLCTADQIADILTKSLTTTRFTSLVKMVMTTTASTNI